MEAYSVDDKGGPGYQKLRGVGKLFKALPPKKAYVRPKKEISEKNMSKTSPRVIKNKSFRRFLLEFNMMTSVYEVLLQI